MKDELYTSFIPCIYVKLYQVRHLIAMLFLAVFFGNGAFELGVLTAWALERPEPHVAAPVANDTECHATAPVVSCECGKCDGHCSEERFCDCGAEQSPGPEGVFFSQPGCGHRDDGKIAFTPPSMYYQFLLPMMENRDFAVIFMDFDHSFIYNRRDAIWSAIPQTPPPEFSC